MCGSCGIMRDKFDFTKTQWRNRKRGIRRCKKCIGHNGGPPPAPKKKTAQRMAQRNALQGIENMDENMVVQKAREALGPLLPKEESYPYMNYQTRSIRI